MIRRSICFGVGLLLSGSAGCGSQEGTHRSVGTDSAGIDILSLEVPSEQTPIVSLEEIVSNSPGTSPVLHTVRDAVLLNSGTLVIANAGNAELLYLKSNGDVANRVGLEGDGPGELRSLVAVAGFGGDSVVAYDSRSGGFQVFDGEASFARSFRLDRVAKLQGVELLGVNANDQLVLAELAWDSVPPGSGMITTRHEIAAYDRQGASRNVILTVEAWDAWSGQPQGGIQLDPMSVPWTNRTIYDLVGSDLLLTDPILGEFRHYDWRGELRKIYRVAGADRVPVKDEDKTEWVEKAAGGAPPPVASMLRNLYREVPVPQFKPTFHSVGKRTSGGVWYRTNGSESIARANTFLLDENWNLEAMMYVPLEVEIVSLSEQMMVGLCHGEFNEIALCKYSLVKNEQALSNNDLEQAR